MRGRKARDRGEGSGRREWQGRRTRCGGPSPPKKHTRASSLGFRASDTTARRSTTSSMYTSTSDSVPFATSTTLWRQHSYLRQSFTRRTCIPMSSFTTTATASNRSEGKEWQGGQAPMMTPASSSPGSRAGADQLSYLLGRLKNLRSLPCLLDMALAPRQVSNTAMKMQNEKRRENNQCVEEDDASFGMGFDTPLMPTLVSLDRTEGGGSEVGS
ncbi:hypothetical protein BKA70DRAFT_138411 [Coprinopsis sp. MPI-PUGE-AT-0042]|nr:hypothetical protein BKA70DRAFT_138411 [Coprinopsis sp. MPI-PUGE-AT-0042]